MPSIPNRCIVAEVTRVATAFSGSCVQSLEAKLFQMVVSRPENWGVGRGASQSIVRRLRHGASHANTWYPIVVVRIKIFAGRGVSSGDGVLNSSSRTRLLWASSRMTAADSTRSSISRDTRWPAAKELGGSGHGYAPS